ncbi:ABC transporter-like [Syntrophomonas zehnderi OL-4]|uniref:ABC transporter-like n=1 Tax=Syntrophomonas zehnderi OL-4 TaxID=690567 RepID=A0A0E4GAP9_9FIRM|nr:ABC transporter ATP-binding protein [Syntrophomonas zehnderi]CFX39712.1 ABC transporter-like [Syntrophomonas zehnderi OL-4]
MALIEARGVEFGYNGIPLFQNINFSIESGELFCLLGPNGCGKTTLLDCILGHLKPLKGEILLNDSNISRIRPEQIARQVAYVPQNHEKTFPYRVLDVVLMGRAAYIGMFDRPGEEDLAIAEEALATVGITHLKDRRYTQLSGGEVQLVMVARALAQRTPVIVMDEPTAHLDFKHELVIMEKVVELVREQGLTILMATHFPNHCFYFENSGLITRVALMSNMNFLALGSPSEVLSEENLKQLYYVNTRVVSFPVDVNQEIKQIIAISTTDSRHEDKQGRSVL